MSWKPNSAYAFNSKCLSSVLLRKGSSFIFLLAFLLGGTTVSAASQNETPVARSTITALDAVEFADSYACSDRFPPQSFCEAVQFKAWTPEEREHVSNTLKSFKGPRFQKILKQIKNSGFNQLHRVSYSSTWYPVPERRRVEFLRRNDKVLLWVNPTTKVIGFTDAFFTGTTFQDPHAQRDRKEINVLHELIHVFDITSNYPSNSDAFKTAMAMAWNGKSYDSKSMTGTDIQKNFQSILELVKQKRSKEAYALDREIGIKNGFPTLYGMTSLQEGFAEVVAYYLLDPQAPQYYSPELQAYLDSLFALNK